MEARAALERRFFPGKPNVKGHTLGVGDNEIALRDSWVARCSGSEIVIVNCIYMGASWKKVPQERANDGEVWAGAVGDPS